MTLVALASAKGSPGVTTTLAVLAATWPADRQLLVVELDPAGNDLAARLGLNADPGLVSLAAQGRRQVVADDLWAHSQPLPGSESGRMVLGPSSAEQTVASLAALRGRLAPVLAEIPNLDVLVDCGRLEPGSPCLDVVAAAALTVVVTRPTPIELHHVANRLTGVLRPDATSVLCVGEKPYSPLEVAEALGVGCSGAIAADSRTADALAGGLRRRSLSRTPLLRSGRVVAEHLAEVMRPVAPSRCAAAQDDLDHRARRVS